ncbi:MAG: HlyD family secretion protein [Planctomycetaceae bacterium]
MDVVRKKSKSGKWWRWVFLLVVIVGGVAATTSGLSNLKPALPEFDRAPVIFDTVQRGTLVREVRGSGTLVPVDITWVTTEVGGQVTEVLVEPGVEVTRETIILKLHDPQMERAVREAERSFTLAKADVERFKISQKSTQLDLKVATATSRANFEESRLQSELHDRLSLRGLISPRQARQSRDKAARSRMLMEVQIERVVNSKKTQQLQYAEKLAWVSRAQDRLNERKEQEAALIVKANVSGTLQQLGNQNGNGLEVGQRVGLGSVVAKITNPTRLMAVLQISQIQSRDVLVGQLVKIDTRNGIIDGRVSRIDPAVQNDRVTVDVELTGELPRGARPDLAVEGLIEVTRLEDVMSVRKPLYSRENVTVEVFRLDSDGETVSRVAAEFGSSSVHTIEVITGLREGDQIVVSDTTRWKSFDRIKLK